MDPLKLTPLTTLVDPGGIWKIGVFFGVVICLLSALRTRIADHFSVPLLALWVVAVGRAVFIAEYPAPLFGQYTTAYQATAGQTAIELILVPLGAICLPRRAIQFLLLCAIVSEILASWGLWGGLMGQGSFSNAFLALCLPFCSPDLILISVVTILTHHGSTAQIMLLLQFFVWLSRNGWPKRGKALAFILISILVIGAMFLHANGALLDGTERLVKWQKYLSFLKEDWTFIFFGLGPGTFMWSSFLIDHFEGDLFPFMHSDWLLILFDLGVSGLILAIWSYILLLKKTLTRTKLFCAALSMAAFAATYHPLEYFPTAFVFCLVIKEAYVQLPRTNGAAR